MVLLCPSRGQTLQEHRSSSLRVGSRPQVDHDLDAFSKRLHDETLAIARSVAPDGVVCRDYWVTERTGSTRRTSQKHKGEGYFRTYSANVITYGDMEG